MTASGHKKITGAWCMYDWADSAFATSLMAAVLPIYFRNIACVTETGATNPLASSLWGYTAAAAMTVIAVLSLVLGTAADYGSSRKRFLTLFISIGTVATAALSLTGGGDWVAVSLIFIIANTGYACGELFYNSLLPHIAAPGQMDRISSRGYAWGYIGGGILLAVNIWMIYALPQTVLFPGGDPLPLLAMRLTFLSVAVWWFLFSLPVQLLVPEPPGPKRTITWRKLVPLAFRRLKRTFSEIRVYRQLFLFLVAFWFYNDGIGTIIKMATIFGDEIGISTLDLIGALALTQVIGIPCSLAFGRLAGRFTTKSVILSGLFVYLLISICAVFMQRALHFWLLAGTVGLVQGGTQALSRSLFASMVPAAKSAEFFSFYNISGKFAGIAGPLLFGIAAHISGSSRMGIVSLVIFFIIGGVLLLRVDVEEGRAAAAPS
ncbi:MFS transporter [bacterium]|nr:MFS transporter [bacterium]